MASERVERDSLGEIRVPQDAYYGAQTQRAVKNFPISGLRFPRSFIRAMGLIKKAASWSNSTLGLLDREIAEALQKACDEVISGRLDEHFPVDIFQTGSGTSTNMNFNEVIARRGAELLGREGNSIHPNDHANMSQSSNDVIPTALHVSAAETLTAALLPALSILRNSLAEKSREFDPLVKVGRTHLQDAIPIRLGQEFSGYTQMIDYARDRIEAALPRLKEVPLGGTAVGTGLNCHPDFAPMVISRLNEWTGLDFREAPNHFEALAARDTCVEMSGALRTVAVSLSKIANDIRWMGSGPRCGLGELQLPPTQPGSSIMPGKVNPVMAESALMVAAQVIGNDSTITVAGLGGNFELNTMMPVIAYNLLQSIELLGNSCRALAIKCIDGLHANRKRLEEIAEQSLAAVTALAPKIGYEAAARVAQKAQSTGRTIREVCQQEALLSEEELGKILDLTRMTQGGILG